MTTSVTQQQIRAFTEGDCWLLAQRLRALTGLPLVFANPWTDDPDYWEHVGLLIDDGVVLDVEGTHARDAWLQRWAPGGVTFVARTEEEVFAAVWDVDRQFHWIDPVSVARVLVEEHGLRTLTTAGGHS